VIAAVRCAVVATTGGETGHAIATAAVGDVGDATAAAGDGTAAGAPAAAEHCRRIGTSQLALLETDEAGDDGKMAVRSSDSRPVSCKNSSRSMYSRLNPAPPSTSGASQMLVRFK